MLPEERLEGKQPALAALLPCASDYIRGFRDVSFDLHDSRWRDHYDFHFKDAETKEQSQFNCPESHVFLR